MTNTLEKKLRFFALYFGQEVHRGNRSKHLDHLSIMRNQKFGHLELKSLSAISDEDAIEVAKLTYAMPYPNGTDFTVYLNQFGKKVVSWGDSFSQKYLAEIDTKTDIYNSLQGDYLRSKGYLLPFMDLSIEQILEYKWAVIK